MSSIVQCLFGEESDEESKYCVVLGQQLEKECDLLHCVGNVDCPYSKSFKELNEEELNEEEEFIKEWKKETKKEKGDN